MKNIPKIFRLGAIKSALLLLCCAGITHSYAAIYGSVSGSSTISRNQRFTIIGEVNDPDIFGFTGAMPDWGYVQLIVDGNEWVEFNAAKYYGYHVDTVADNHTWANIMLSGTLPPGTHTITAQFVPSQQYWQQTGLIDPIPLSGSYALTIQDNWAPYGYTDITSITTGPEDYYQGGHVYNLDLAGWLADYEDGAGSGVTRIEAWAVLNGPDQITPDQFRITDPLTITMNGYRPDVVDVHGRPDFAYSGWTLTGKVYLSDDQTYTIYLYGYDNNGARSVLDAWMTGGAGVINNGHGGPQ